MEIWKAVEGWPGYEVSDQGRVRHVKYLAMPPHPGSGYLRVHLCGKKKSGQHVFKVHQLVAAAFNGPKPDGMQIDHVDGNKANNTASNLEYVTCSENVRRAVARGLIKPPRPCHRNKAQFHSKLTEAQVAEIKRLIPDHTLREIGKRFGVSGEMIRLIKAGKLWT